MANTQRLVLPFQFLGSAREGSTRLRFVVCVLALTVACNDFGPTRPAEPPAVEVIRVGEQVIGTFTGLPLYFELAAPKKGRGRSPPSVRRSS